MEKQQYKEVKDDLREKTIVVPIKNWRKQL